MRDQVLAYLFGAGNAMDAFNVATRIPNLMRDLFAEGAMSAAFVPTFMRKLTHDGRAAAWRLGAQLINALIAVTGVVALAGMVFAEPLVRLLAGSYAEVPGKLELTVLLTRILFPFLTLVAVAAAMMGMLNSVNRFFAPALSPAMYNVGIIAAGALLLPLMPGLGLDPIVAIAVGALLGGMGQVALQAPMLRREGFRYQAALDPHDEGLRNILRLMGPGTLAGAAVQINLLVNMVLATGQGTGAVSWLSYAFRVMYLPIGLFGVSNRGREPADRLAPRRAGRAARDTRCSVARAPADADGKHPGNGGPDGPRPADRRADLRAGEFHAGRQHGDRGRAPVLCPGLAGYSAVRIAVPCFYALGDSRTPTAVSLGAVALNIVLNLALVQVLGYRGLALGTSIAAVANALTLLALLRRPLGGLDLPRIVLVLIKITIAAAAMGIAAWSLHAWLAETWTGATSSSGLFGSPPPSRPPSPSSSPSRGSSGSANSTSRSISSPPGGGNWYDVPDAAVRLRLRRLLVRTWHDDASGSAPPLDECRRLSGNGARPAARGASSPSTSASGPPRSLRGSGSGSRSPTCSCTAASATSC